MVLVVAGGTISTIQLRGANAPTVNTTLSTLSVSSITNGIRINLDSSSVRGSVILCAPDTVLASATIKETSK